VVVSVVFGGLGRGEPYSSILGSFFVLLMFVILWQRGVM
jgi:hypothetical protein